MTSPDGGSQSLEGTAEGERKSTEGRKEPGVLAVGKGVTGPGIPAADTRTFKKAKSAATFTLDGVAYTIGKPNMRV